MKYHINMNMNKENKNQQKINANGKKVADRIAQDGTILGEIYELMLPNGQTVRHHTGYHAENDEKEIPNIQ